MLWNMAKNGNGIGGGDARPSTANPTNDVELKNILIDLVKERYSMTLEIFWAFLVSILNLCCSVDLVLYCMKVMKWVNVYNVVVGPVCAKKWKDLVDRQEWIWGWANIRQSSTVEIL